MSVDQHYTPEFNLGMRPAAKQLYRADDRSPWDEWTQKAVHTDIKAASYVQECALIVRHEPHPSNNNEAALHSITVQSPLIRKTLEATFDGYAGLNTQLKQLTFNAPFHPFYYRWHLFEKLHENEQGQEAKSHLGLLYDVLSKEIVPHIEAMQDFTKNAVISFDSLWTLFSPDMEIYTRIDGQERILQLRESRYGASMSGEYFSLECRYVDCDGSRFGYVETSVEINSFDGVKRFEELDAIPVHLHSDAEGLLRRLNERGEKFEGLNGFRHRQYEGFYTARGSRQVKRRHVGDAVYLVGRRLLIGPSGIG